ncbi:aldo/keto reductase [Salinibacterium hongtaonis]|uniref:Alcohol dehydrogenase n=1 Tax=Homoserinimonas hongtaonis TaxID=2079791 RepID=A0A2U1T0P2_9MICO|nr:aldo/keto reductase [Salinibacterium hongtaonis]PWB97343.1 alcohol dehydrogenase [Salinibacterium hongtaonis]
MTNPFSDSFPLVLGGNVFGWTADEPESHRVLDAFVAAGGDHVDTADGYSAWVPGNTGGDSERIIGSWLASRGNRDTVTIASKVATHPEFTGLSPANIAAAADASLARLGTDYIDLYYAHFDDETQSIEDIATAFDALVKAGKIHSIGVSNFSPERIDAWFAAAKANGLSTPVALQPHYNLLARGYETTYAPVAERHGLGVFTYFSLAAGMLTGKYRSAADVEGAARGRTLAPLATESAFSTIAALVEVADEVGATPTAVALAWLQSKPSVTAPIASARSVEQLEGLLASVELQLDPALVERLDAASAVPAAA